MTTATDEAVILAAITAVGPAPQKVEQRDGRTFTCTDDLAWRSAIAEKVVEIRGMLTDGVITKTVEQVASAKTFTGVVVSVEHQANNNRVKVVLNTGTEKAVDGLPAGHESVLTERLERHDGRSIATKARMNIGRFCRVVVEVETMANGNKSRVLRNVIDLGQPRDSATA